MFPQPLAKRNDRRDFLKDGAEFRQMMSGHKSPIELCGSCLLVGFVFYLGFKLKILNKIYLLDCAVL